MFICMRFKTLSRSIDGAMGIGFAAIAYIAEVEATGAIYRAMEGSL